MLTRAGAARPPGGATLALRPSSSALDAGERGDAEGPRSAVQTALPGPRRPGVESWFCPDQRHAPAHPGTPRHAPSSGGGASVPSSRRDRGCYLCSRGSAPLAGPFALLYLIPPLLWGALGPPRLTTASATGARVTPVARTTYPAPHPKPAARILAFPPLRCLSNPSLRLSVPVPVASLRAASAVACRLVHLPPLHPQALLQPPVHGSAA